MEEWQYRPAGDQELSPAAQLRSQKRESGLGVLVTQEAWRLLVRTHLRVFHRIAVAGRDNLPARPPLVLVANHSSHLDAPILASVLPFKLRALTVPIAAGDAFFESRTRALFSVMFLNAVPLWRARTGQSHALADLRARLLAGDVVYVAFPEGTRSRDGELLPFKPGIGMLVAESDVPVLPCWLDGTFAAFPPHRRLPRPRRIRLTIGEPLRFQDVANQRRGWEEIAARLEAAVRALAAGAQAERAP